MDNRIGKKKASGEYEAYPSVTMSGKPLHPKPHTTIGLENGYFVVQDVFIKQEKHDAILAELRGVVQSYAAPKASNKAEKSE
jgi:hypothetical protein